MTLLPLRRALANWIYPTSELSALRIQLAEASAARIVAEDNSRFWQSEHESMSEKLEQSHLETIEAHKRMTDVLAMQRWGTQIHGTMEIPITTPGDQKPVLRRGTQGRRLVQQQKSRFRDDLLHRNDGVEEGSVAS